MDRLFFLTSPLNECRVNKCIVIDRRMFSYFVDDSVVKFVEQIFQVLEGEGKGHPAVTTVGVVFYYQDRRIAYKKGFKLAD